MKGSVLAGTSSFAGEGQMLKAAEALPFVGAALQQSHSFLAVKSVDKLIQYFIS